MTQTDSLCACGGVKASRSLRCIRCVRAEQRAHKVCPECGKPKNKKSKRCVTCRRQKEYKRTNICPSCKGKKSYQATVCADCFTRTGRPSQNGGDPLMVSGVILGKVLNEWVARWKGERPPATRTGFGQDQPFFTAEAYLVEVSGINMRAVWGILHGEFKFVTLNRADKLLTGLGLEYMLQNGEIPVVANPNWTQEKWHEYMEARGCA